MSYRHASAALSLAKQELARKGITRPTPAQILAALDGGTITIQRGKVRGESGGEAMSCPGILTLRANGLGWEQIAQQIGLKAVTGSGPRSGSSAVIVGVQTQRRRMEIASAAVASI
jgi:hypothetical protein